jgi:hypothetical protein
MQDRRRAERSPAQRSAARRQSLERILSEYAQRSLNTWQRLMIEPDLFYILVILLLYRLYRQSDLTTKWPCGFQYDELLRKSERCLGGRFRYLTSLLTVGEHYS